MQFTMAGAKSVSSLLEHKELSKTRLPGLPNCASLSTASKREQLQYVAPRKTDCLHRCFSL